MQGLALIQLWDSLIGCFVPRSWSNKELPPNLAVHTWTSLGQYQKQARPTCPCQHPLKQKLASNISKISKRSKRIRQQFGELMFFLQEILTKQEQIPSPNLHQDSTDTSPQAQMPCKPIADMHAQFRSLHPFPSHQYTHSKSTNIGYTYADAD